MRVVRKLCELGERSNEKGSCQQLELDWKELSEVLDDCNN